MGQSEIYKLLKKKPGLTTRQIAEELGQSIFAVSNLIGKMLDRDLEGITLSKEERKELEKKYPTLRKSPSIKIYIIKIDDKQ